MEPLPPALPPAYKDRRTGLLLFGILEIVLGAFFALSVPVALIGQVMNARQLGQPVPWALTLATMAQMAVFAAALIWLGIGSVMTRRWARAILLCGSWLGLVVGMALCVMLPFMWPSMRVAMEQQNQRQPLPPAMLEIMLIVATVFMAAMYVMIPGAMVLFYRSRHVKRTCEARDPVERWTDRCPLPVLGAVLLLGYSAFATLMFLPQYGRAFLLFGAIITGVPAMVLWILLAGFMVWAAVGFYRLQARAWWAYVVFMVVFGVSTVIIFGRIDLLDYYRAAGLPEAQIEQIRGSPLLQSGRMLWLVLPLCALFLGYLIYLRRFFFVKPVAPAGANLGSVTE